MTTQQIYKMDPAISIQKQKITLQLKYLLSIKNAASEQQTLEVLNKVHPFRDSPLKKLPPLELQEFEPSQIITDDLKTILSSYALIILLGKVRIQQSIYFIDEQHLIDDSIKEELVFNFEEGMTQLRALGSPVTILKVHKIWIRIAQQQKQKREKDYIRSKLLKIPFFNKLSFEQFNKILKVSKLMTIGPGQTLLAQCTTPYNMYIVTEGELVLTKTVKFAEEAGVWKQLQLSLQKKDDFSEELFQYLVRQPTSKSPIFSAKFQIGILGEGAIICGTETLNQVPLGFTISSSLATKYLAIKYPDLYVLEQSRLTEIRSWPTREIDKKQLRRQYYYEQNWEGYKHYLMEDQQLSELQAMRFEDFLRKQVNLSMKKYSYSSSKVGEGYIIDSPGSKMCRVKDMTFKK